MSPLSHPTASFPDLHPWLGLLNCFALQKSKLLTVTICCHLVGFCFPTISKCTSVTRFGGRRQTQSLHIAHPNPQLLRGPRSLPVDEDVREEHTDVQMYREDCALFSYFFMLVIIITTLLPSLSSLQTLPISFKFMAFFIDGYGMTLCINICRYP